ncbi:hypothetical protein HUU05_18935 [candidate division KSB1 bacterium]|nr:hypothetical protein [candidate division KSB1 bacterium]
MHSKEYLLPLSNGVRKRHYHELEKGRVIAFMVQLEIYYEGRWRNVLRYDSAHGFSHIDRYNLKGEQIKESLDLTFDEALALADVDINENWENYRDRFLKGMHP